VAICSYFLSRVFYYDSCLRFYDGGECEPELSLREMGLRAGG
jgi:hypothetical protein